MHDILLIVLTVAFIAYIGTYWIEGIRDAIRYYRQDPTPQPPAVDPPRPRVSAASILIAARNGTPVTIALHDDSPVPQILDSNGIEFLGVEGVLQGQCPICWTALQGQPCFECPNCRTKHHKECLSYLGHCATYGCGRSVRVADHCD